LHRNFKDIKIWKFGGILCKILGFTFIVTIYDNRHWDDENNIYQKYETKQ
jgi:hypothetical protein